MISFFRSIFGTKIGGVLALAFIILIGVAFALSDVSGSLNPGSVGATNAARVGDQNIPVREVEDSLKNRLRAERRQNPTLDMVRLVEGGGLDQTVDQIINRYALAVFGEEYGLGVSKRLVDSEIAKIPQSKGLDGKFSAEAFGAFLSNIGLTEKFLRADITQNMYARQILSTSIKGAETPSSLVLPYASLILEKRVGNMAAVPSAAYMPKEPPSDAELAKFYKDKSTQFTIPEKRAISYAFFDKDLVAEKAKPTEAQIAAYYEENADEFAASETLNVAQVVAPTEAAAKAIAAKVSGGESLANAAKAVGLAVSEQKDVTKNALSTSTSKAVAEAAFATQKGAIAAPARGGLGWYVTQVTGKSGIAARSLAQASGEISKLIEVAQREELLGELTSEIEDKFADGASLAEVTKTQKLEVQTTPKLLANGINPEDRNYKPIPEMQVILPAAFDMVADGDAQLIEIVPGERFAMIEIAELEEAAPPPLEEVKKEISSAWAIDQGSKKAKEAAEKVLKAVAGGKSLKQALADLKVPLPPVQKLSGTRQGLTPKGQRLSPPVALLFSMKKGSVKKLAAPGGNGWFLVEAVEIERGDASKKTDMLKARRTEMSQIMQQEYRLQLVSAIIADVGVERNEDAIAGLRARLTNKNQ